MVQNPLKLHFDCVITKHNKCNNVLAYYHDTLNVFKYVIHLFVVYFNEPYVVYVNAIVSIFLWS